MEFNKVVLGALGYVYEYRVVLAKALLIPFVLYMALDATELLELSAAPSFAIALLGLVVQTVFAITTHRIVLLGPGSMPQWGLYRWSKRETLFVLHLLGLVLIMVPIFLLAVIPIVGWLVAIGVMCWVAGRLSLVFPAIAIDQGVSFKLSWELTQKYQWLMFLVVVIFPAFILLPALILSFLPYTFFLTSLITTFATIFIVAALSVSYKIISQETYGS